METAFERIERLLALILVENIKDRKTEDKVKILNTAGFSNIEVAELLNIKPQVVANYLFKSKKKK